MARRKKHRRRKIHGPTYARRRKRRMHGPTYAMGKHRKRRRRIGAAEGMMASTKEFAMVLLGGGMAKIGMDMLNPMLYGMAKGPLIPALLKGAGGAILFHNGHKGSPLVMGAGIGMAVSGLEDTGRALQLPWLPFLPLEAGSDGTYKYKMVAGPPKDLFVIIPDKGVNGPADAPVIAASADAPIIAGPTDAPVIGGYGPEYPNMQMSAETFFEA